MTAKSPAPRPPRPIETEQRGINTQTPPISVTNLPNQQPAQPATKQSGNGGQQEQP